MGRGFGRPTPKPPVPEPPAKSLAKPRPVDKVDLESIGERVGNDNAAGSGRGDTGEVWDAHGGVDFSKSSHLATMPKGTRAIVEIEYTGSRSGDFAAANQQAGLEHLGAKPPEGYTWHHVRDYSAKTNRGTMQLVDENAHAANAPHNGGVSQYKEAHGVEDYGR
jgi:hypothetical protein